MEEGVAALLLLMVATSRDGNCLRASSHHVNHDSFPQSVRLFLFRQDCHCAPPTVFQKMLPSGTVVRYTDPDKQKAAGLARMMSVVGSVVYLCHRCGAIVQVDMANKGVTLARVTAAEEDQYCVEERPYGSAYPLPLEFGLKDLETGGGDNSSGAVNTCRVALGDLTSVFHAWLAVAKRGEPVGFEALLRICTRVTTGHKSLDKAVLALKFGTALTRLPARGDVGGGGVVGAVAGEVADRMLTDGTAMCHHLLTGSRAWVKAAVKAYVQAQQNKGRRKALRGLAALIYAVGETRASVLRAPLPGLSRNYCELALKVHRMSGGNDASSVRASYLEAAASACKDMQDFEAEVRYRLTALDVRDSVARAQEAAALRELNTAQKNLRDAQVTAHRKRRAEHISGACGTGGSSACS